MLEPGPWVAYLQAMSGFISGDELARVSVLDYLAYDEALSGQNWRLPGGYDAFVAASATVGVTLSAATEVESVELDGRRVALQTHTGTIRAHALIMTASTDVLVGDAIAWPSALDPWRDTARRLAALVRKILLRRSIRASLR
nr:FAD-dependent oxidoreductase [Rhizobium tibeticum]